MRRRATSPTASSPADPLQIEVFGQEEWAALVADRFGELVSGSPGMRISLPTGRTPQPFFAELVERQLEMSPVELFLLDEFGGIARDHPARCERMLRTELIDPLDAPPHLHLIDIEAADLDAAAADYDIQVGDGGLDLVVLGLGTNGHVALNEPGSAPDSPTRVVRLAQATQTAAAAYGAGDDVPTWGVTLGMRSILAAREVWLLVTGEAKARILQRVVTGDIGPNVPASLLRTHPNATILSDEPAATT
jgi:glucosamine-6-phosphate deaminase